MHLESSAFLKFLVPPLPHFWSVIGCLCQAGQ